MGIPLQGRFSFQELATSMLLFVIVYQLGACPCGCIEHNAWFQMTGMSDHDHAEATADMSLGWAADHHDCTGEPAPAYFNNARTIQVASQIVDLLPAAHASLASVAIVSRITGASNFSPGISQAAFAAAPDRPALQVFRL